MYTDQFKTKQSLTDYAFNILKGLATGYSVNCEEIKGKLIIHIKDDCKISITVNNDKIIPKGFQTFDNEDNLICSYGGFNCGIAPLFHDVGEYIKEHKTKVIKYEQLTLFDINKYKKNI